MKKTGEAVKQLQQSAIKRFFRRGAQRRSPLSIRRSANSGTATHVDPSTAGTKKGGLVHIRHDDVAMEFANLARQATRPTAVSSEPFIFSGRAASQGASGGGTRADGTPVGVSDERADILVQSYWKRGYDCLFDVRITDTDAPSYRDVAPESVLRSQERAKKRKYLEPCLERRRHFTPLVFSVDGLRGTEADAALQRLASLLAGKWGQNYSQTCQFVRSRMSVALVRGTTMCLRGQRDHLLRRRNYDWGDGDGGMILHDY